MLGRLNLQSGASSGRISRTSTAIAGPGTARPRQQACGQGVCRQPAPAAGGLSSQGSQAKDLDQLWTARARVLLGAAAAVKRHSHQRTEAHHLYEAALELSRQEDHEAARAAFEVLLKRYPHLTKAWVSYAQMEKRIARTSTNNTDTGNGAAAALEGLQNCRQVLQRGLRLNPDSACLAQAWGLMELQKGNLWAAVRLLERCVMMDPACSPVLRWRHVDMARQNVMCCKGRRACVIAAGTASAKAGASGITPLGSSGVSSSSGQAQPGGWLRGGAATGVSSNAAINTQ